MTETKSRFYHDVISSCQSWLLRPMKLYDCILCLNRLVQPSHSSRKISRRAANRRSALESRQRRKVLIEDLQKQVAVLNKETTELRAINETLRVQFESSLSENQQLRLMISQQLGGTSTGLQGAMSGGPSVALFGGGAPRGGTLGGGFTGYMGGSPGMFSGLGGPSTSLLGHGSLVGFGSTDLSGGQVGKNFSFGTQPYGQMGDVARHANIGHIGGYSDVNDSADIEALAKRARIMNEFSKKYPPG